MQKILVTGGRGFVGRHLVQRLLQLPDVQVYTTTRASDNKTLHPWQLPTEETNQKLFEVSVDLEVEANVRYLFDRVSFDVIFHLAANPLVKTDAAQPTKITQTNVAATHRLLAFAKPGTKFVFASSATVYGEQGGWYRCTENAPLKPNSVYGATKVAGEALVHAYTELGHVHGRILRLVANVGTHTTHGIFHDFVRKLRSPSPTFDLIGSNPGSVKPYVHVRDTAEAFVQAAFDSEWQQVAPVNIVHHFKGCGTEISVLTFAQTVMNYLGIQKPINWLGSESTWKGDNKRVAIDGDFAKRLGWKPTQPTSELAIGQACLDVLEQERVGAETPAVEH